MAERWHHREPDTKTVKTWYFMGSFSDIPEWMFAIDLHPERLGWVYSCHKQDHASFEDFIVAKSFTEFLERMIAAKGKYEFFRTDTFTGYGTPFAWKEMRDAKRTATLAPVLTKREIAALAGPLDGMHGLVPALEVVRRCITRPDCQAVPLKRKHPKEIKGFAVPEDFLEVFSTYDGLDMFVEQEYGWILCNFGKAIIKMDDDIRAMYPAEYVPAPEVTRTWYHIGCIWCEGAWTLAMDLHPLRSGWIYDAHPELYREKANPIIAKSFTEFLNRLAASEGKYCYWLERESPDYGTPY
jgi:hypothetical protein